MPDMKYSTCTSSTYISRLFVFTLCSMVYLSEMNSSFAAATIHPSFVNTAISDALKDYSPSNESANDPIPSFAGNKQATKQGGNKLEKVIEATIEDIAEHIEDAEPPEVETVENEKIDDLFRNYIGPGVGVYQQPFVGGEWVAVPEVQASLNWGPIFATDMGMGSFIYGDDFMAAALALTADFRSTTRNSISELRGMDDIQDVYNISLISFVYGDFGRMGIALMKELNGDEGYSAIARWQYEVTSGAWSGSPRINIIWRNKDSANYVYGVQAHEANASRPAYQLDSSLRTVISYEIGYEFARHWQAVIGLEYSAYNSEVSDSPIIAKDQTYGFWLALRKDI
jgi:outer membrane scaffolding protein for murein synthesis (MipA/OmpV family)